eukprot:246594-Pyramimonas_sp.AAC.1
MSAVNVTQVAILVRSVRLVESHRQIVRRVLRTVAGIARLLSDRFVCQQDNPSRFTNPLQFEIQYECLNDLQE